MAGVTLDSAVGAFLNDVDGLRRGPVTVVAHSLGGTVVTEAAQRAPELFAAVRADFDSAPGRKRARAALYGDVAAGTAERALSMLSCDVATGVDARVAATADGFGGLDKTWVLCTQDRALTPRLQRRLIGEVDAVSVRAATVVELDCSHSPFLSRPAELSHVIAAAAARARP